MMVFFAVNADATAGVAQDDNAEQAKMLGSFFGAICGYLLIVIATIAMVDMCFPDLTE